MNCPIGTAIFALIFALGVSASADEQTGHWQAAEIVAFTDVDDLQVKLGGKPHRAFFVGLRPLRETAGKDQLDELRKAVLDKLRNNALSARVVTRRGDAVGLSVDTFMHHKNDFGHGWTPRGNYYCWTGWGAYNFNCYFLQTKTAEFLDNCGKNEIYRGQLTENVCGMRAAEQAAALVPDLGSKRFATRDRASRELQAIGGPAVFVLQKAAESAGDLETRLRAEQILRAIEQGGKEQKKLAWAAPAK
jgi:hypothetical protein